MKAFGSRMVLTVPKLLTPPVEVKERVKIRPNSLAKALQEEWADVVLLATSNCPESSGSTALTLLARPGNSSDCGPTNPPRADSHVQKALITALRESGPRTGGQGSGVHFPGTFSEA